MSQNIVWSTTFLNNSIALGIGHYILEYCGGGGTGHLAKKGFTGKNIMSKATLWYDMIWPPPYTSQQNIRIFSDVGDIYCIFDTRKSMGYLSTPPKWCCNLNNLSIFSKQNLILIQIRCSFICHTWSTDCDTMWYSTW